MKAGLQSSTASASKQDIRRQSASSVAPYPHRPAITLELQAATPDPEPSLVFLFSLNAGGAIDIPFATGQDFINEWNGTERKADETQGAQCLKTRECE